MGHASPSARTGTPPTAHVANSWSDDEKARREAALGLDLGGDHLKGNEIKSLEALQSLDPGVPLSGKIRWIPKRWDGGPSHDFIWTFRDDAPWEMKTPDDPSKRNIRDLIRQSVRKARENRVEAVAKDRFLVDISPHALTPELRKNLSRYNIDNPGNTIRELLVLSSDGLEEVRLL